MKNNKINLPEIADVNSPVQMLNMLRFKDRKLYVDEYLTAFNTIVEKLGIKGAKVIFLSDVLVNLIADANEKWDAILLVEYPSVDAFRTVAESNLYHEIAAPIRIAALSEWKVYMTRQAGL